MKAHYVITGDGSYTLFSERHDDHYHSVNGAMTESMYIFIHCGLHEKMRVQQHINVLEVGFGTGLNALCTFDQAEKYDLLINYTGVEPEPLHKSVVKKLNYASLFDQSSYANIFFSFHQLEKNIRHSMSKNFVFEFVNAQIQGVDLPVAEYDLAYFDPFKPDTNKEIWSVSVFTKIFHSMKPEGILLTYSSKGEVRRAMKEAGFTVEKIPGPDGKREITRATKKDSNRL